MQWSILSILVLALIDSPFLVIVHLRLKELDLQDLRLLASWRSTLSIAILPIQ